MRGLVRMAQGLDTMRGAAEIYRAPGNGYWLPNAERRAAAVEARLAAML
jgi:hypothetical protein